METWIGAGGWGYFRGASGTPLVDYARGFRFVEVNSTFYRHPSTEAVRRWRRSVPPGFRFAVKGHRSITHVHRFTATRGALAAIARDGAVTKTLGSDLLVLETPADLEFGREEVAAVTEFSGALGDRVRIAMEARAYAGRRLPDPLSKALRDAGGIDVVDLARGDLPRVESDVLYTRVFGKGAHNVWELSDDELREVDAASRGGRSDRMVFAFHGVRMYKDAARFLEFRPNGAFVPATKGQGTLAVAEVLAPDARFPTTRQDLLRDHGWKVVTREDGRNVHAREYLARLPARTFPTLAEALQSLRDAEAGPYIPPRKRGFVVAVTTLGLLSDPGMTRKKVQRNVPVWHGLCDGRGSEHVCRVPIRRNDGHDALEAVEGSSPPDGVPLPGVPEGHPRDAVHR